MEIIPDVLPRSPPPKPADREDKVSLSDSASGVSAPTIRCRETALGLHVVLFPSLVSCHFSSSRDTTEMPLTPAMETFSAKGHMVSILDFVGPVWSLPHVLLYMLLLLVSFNPLNV